jgi:hypothetical protein
MKKWIYTGMVALLYGGAAAQVTFGVRAGATYASLTQIVDEEVTSDGRIGFSAGGLMDIPVVRNFSLRPELSLISLGGAYYVANTEGWLSGFDKERHEISYYSVRIPVNAAYKIRSSDWLFCVYGGPSLSVSTQVREKGFREKRRFRPIDAGLGAGFSVQHRHVFTSICINSGLLDRQARKTSGESQLYQNSVTLSLGYWFR